VKDLYAACHAVGGMTAHYRLHDPQRLAFVAARYLFVAKMLAGCGDVLEVGCADGYFSGIVRQHVGRLTAIDIDAESIAQARAMNSPTWPIDFRQGGIGDWPRQHSASYCLDVLEHIDPAAEFDFLGRLSYCGGGFAIVGTPSLASQRYASELSRKGHVNCKSGSGLLVALYSHFDRVEPWSMNDTAFYPGFSEMARYYLAVCTN
jgi:SAM-dependent methyltransferase